MKEKIGYWEEHYDYVGDDVQGFYTNYYECSECHFQPIILFNTEIKNYNYCPFCGIEMKGIKYEQTN